MTEEKSYELNAKYLRHLAKQMGRKILRAQEKNERRGYPINPGYILGEFFEMVEEEYNKLCNRRYPKC